ncbi:hypothetical protein [Devosia sp.]|jgi:hypothetical protein|uniref:hypothetical protein n=1 Tax=Devosia sp. TaxID=1871048 RepID=UPI0037BF3EEC
MIMIDNRIALSAVAAARLFAVIALTCCAVSFGTGQSYAQSCPPDCGPGNNDPGIPDPNAPPDDQNSGDPNTPPADPNAVPDTGNSSGNGGQTTQPTLPEPQATSPTVVTPTAIAPVTVTSSVGDPFVTTTIVTVSTTAPLLVGSGRNDLISHEAVIEAMLPDGMKSSAENAYRLLSMGSIDLGQIEAAASAYKAFSDLDSVEQQTLFEFMLYGQTPLRDGYLTLMKILPSDDPFRARLLEYGAASLAATQASGNRLWAFKRAVTLGYSGKIARLSGLSPDFLKKLC